MDVSVNLRATSLGQEKGGQGRERFAIKHCPVYVPGPTQCSHTSSPFICTGSLKSRYLYPHLKDEETEAYKW